MKKITIVITCLITSLSGIALAQFQGNLPTCDNVSDCQALILIQNDQTVVDSDSSTLASDNAKKQADLAKKQFDIDNYHSSVTIANLSNLQSAQVVNNSSN